MTGVIIKLKFGVMRLGLASQAYSQNPTLLGSIPGDLRFSNSISNPNPNPNLNTVRAKRRLGAAV